MKTDSTDDIKLNGFKDSCDRVFVISQFQLYRFVKLSRFGSIKLSHLLGDLHFNLKCDFVRGLFAIGKMSD